MSFCLHSIKVENLRGYRKAELPLGRPRIVLVGKNNTGKTSILKLLDWLLNDLDLDELSSKSPKLLTDEERDLLLPARNVGNRARRLWLRVHVSDGRRHKRFHCDNAGIGSLRVNIRVAPRHRLFLKLSPPKKGEADNSENEAIELLNELRQRLIFIHVPSFRDANSLRFLNTLNDALQARLAERALHVRQGGAPAEYRAIRAAMDELEKVAEELAEPLWEDMQSHFPPGLARRAEIDFS